MYVFFLLVRGRRRTPLGELVRSSADQPSRSLSRASESAGALIQVSGGSASQRRVVHHLIPRLPSRRAAASPTLRSSSGNKYMARRPRRVGRREVALRDHHEASPGDFRGRLHEHVFSSLGRLPGAADQPHHQGGGHRGPTGRLRLRRNMDQRPRVLVDPAGTTFSDQTTITCSPVSGAAPSPARHPELLRTRRTG